VQDWGNKEDLQDVSEEDIGMTVKELKKIAKERGINGAKMLKADLIRAIQVKEGN